MVESSLIAKMHVLDYAMLHVIINAMSLVPQHVGVDVVMHALPRVGMYVLDVVLCVFHLVKLNVKIIQDIHV